jgi:hypothetical protein
LIYPTQQQIQHNNRRTIFLFCFTKRKSRFVRKRVIATPPKRPPTANDAIPIESIDDAFQRFIITCFFYHRKAYCQYNELQQFLLLQQQPINLIITITIPMTLQPKTLRLKLLQDLPTKLQ